MKRQSWIVAKGAGVQEWHPEQAGGMVASADLFRQVEAENQAKNHQALVDAYRVERSQDWAELARQPVGAESL